MSQEWALLTWQQSNNEEHNVVYIRTLSRAESEYDTKLS